ncbi:PREDICTED: la-related protein 6B-like isoform X2 [Nicotiana attenuata]|uniref:La-related protein 6b n=1 Tax=Nicotiana attenuata TaxID=49451 RepID=A0A1J6IIM7_NICAT|nr:PREDICTED: la-related protein 6B-like isoform X2 [Nicotiana attenuata]OIS97582.1 la-related protein 6b [Nicotiana attenuata]
MALEESATVIDSLPDSFNSSAATTSSSSLYLDRPFDQTASSSPSDPPPALSRNSSLNALAPAFVPRTSSSPSLPSSPSISPSTSLADLNQAGKTLVHVYATPAANFHPVQNHFVYAPQFPVQYPSPFYGGVVDGVAQEMVVGADLDHASKNGGLTEEAVQKIINQVEFYFSDLNLATTDHLIKHMLKDPEGYVPISVVALFKKIKALVDSHTQLAQVLRSSTKLVVSDDGMKVKRKIPLTETDLKELQSRIVIAENLPEDHCHQKLMKIFSTVGSVKMIRTCQPQYSSGGASSGSRTAKSDIMMYSNKLHAFVEYESIKLAETAVAELNDEDNWRNGLKVRLLLRHTEKCGQARGKKVGHESEQNFKEDDGFALEVNEKLNEESSHHLDARSNELAEEHDSDGMRKRCGHARGKGQGQGQGRGHGRPQFHQNNCGGHLGAPMSNINRGSSAGNAPSNVNRVGLGQPVFDQSVAAKQSSVPRMSDGTKGFSMGRGVVVFCSARLNVRTICWFLTVGISS